ncbi:molybdenum cofactor biosynthesis protein [Ephemerocybe angulata]|uniref:Molybdenum cofactor biosynthesis protein n=1 Tax=Ephemerocybe angulata TaxID=980116 RepID=A0A8H6HNM2_9AGAR|nr:molybdenum cofactor biosynthesis protein [Tulosesus angulatus]
MSPLRAAVLTVSDTASRDASTDQSGPTIRQILADKGIVVGEDDHTIVPDDVDAIQRVIRAWTGREGDTKIDWIITSGGTGFGVRDVTPEAISPLITRQASGLVHLMLAASLKHTPLAALSRPVAGTIGATMITTLPGSAKAVQENLDALFVGGVIDHAVDLVRGGSGKRVHDSLQSNNPRSEGTSDRHGHHHHHHHHGHGHGHGHGHQAPQPRSSAALSHDPSAPPSARHRQSPYPIISLDEALQFIDRETVTLSVETRKVDHTLRGYILAEDIYAPQDAPLTSTTSVDGYALRSTDPPGVYKVVTSSTHKIADPLPEGTIYRINTGGPLPAGTDTVIMVEDTKLVSTFTAEDAPSSDLVGEEKEVETLAQIPQGENVRKPGSDVRKGDLVLKKGERLLSGGGEVGSLAFVGRTEVSAYKKPVVAILSTGNELVDLHQTQAIEEQISDQWGGIYDTNRPSLQAALEGLGYTVVDLGIVKDTIDAHVTALQKGLAEADLIISTGGTSMGPTDLLKPVIERNLNGKVHFGRVAIKPGKPTTFAVVKGSANEDRDVPIFALPGNPASALVTFYVFVLPALRKLAGWPEGLRELPKVKVQVQGYMPFDPRTEFHRVNVKVRATTGVLEAWSTGGQRSSRVASLSGANGLVVLPQLSKGSEGAAEKKGYEKGEWAQAVLIGELEVV